MLKAFNWGHFDLRTRAFRQLLSTLCLTSNRLSELERDYWTTPMYEMWAAVNWVVKASPRSNSRFQTSRSARQPTLLLGMECLKLMTVLSKSFITVPHERKRLCANNNSKFIGFAQQPLYEFPSRNCDVFISMRLVTALKMYFL